MELLILCALWIIWCFLHSYLVAANTAVWFKNWLGERAGSYRLLYNIFSLVTVLPLFHWQRNMPGAIVIPLPEYLVIAKYIIMTGCALIIAGAFVSFDKGEFLGTKQLRSGKRQEASTVIKKHGLYAIVRHPMYLAGIVFFSVSMLDASLPQFLGYLILTIYMFIGTVREDRRLARELGEQYRNYQKDVPMLLPKLFQRKK